MALPCGSPECLVMQCQFTCPQVCPLEKSSLSSGQARQQGLPVQ